MRARVVLPSGSVPFVFPLAAAPLGTYMWLTGVTQPATIALVAPLQATPFTIVP